MELLRKNRPEFMEVHLSADNKLSSSKLPSSGGGEGGGEGNNDKSSSLWTQQPSILRSVCVATKNTHVKEDGGRYKEQFFCFIASSSMYHDIQVKHCLQKRCCGFKPIT